MGTAENRQVVADVYAAFGQGDIGAVIELTTDDVVWTNHGPAASPLSGVFHGKDGVQTFFGLVNDTLDISKFDLRTIVADGDAVVVWIDSVATVRSNGKTIEGPLAHWMTLRDGKLATFDEFEHDTHDGWT
ncbi:MAG: nuclear transport factor 2 family protein [Pseudonocardiales bacterium]